MTDGANDPTQHADGPRGDGVARAVRDGTAVKEISLFEIVNIGLRHRRLIGGIAVVLCVVAGVGAMLLPKGYEASASFMPQSVEEQSMRSAMAENLGLPTNTSRQSPAFYADLMKTRRILEKAVGTEYEFTANGKQFSGTLPELYEVEAGEPENRTRAAMAVLEDAIELPRQFPGGVVPFSVEAPWDPLAEQLAARLLELVNEFNVETRQSSAKAESEFVEQRLDEARVALREAERRVTEFLRNNRRYSNSPQLVAEYERLQRRVSLRQQAVVNLTQNYGQARIDAVRTTPVITIIEQPEGSARPARPVGPAVMALAGLVFGAMLGLLIAFIKDFMARIRRRDRDDIREFIALQDEVVGELRGVGHRIRRSLPAPKRR